MHEHVSKSTIGVRGVAELGISADKGINEAAAQASESPGFSNRRPTPMDVKDQRSARANSPRDVAEKMIAMVAALHHPEGAEHTNRVVGRVIHQAIQFNQICVDGGQIPWQA